LTNFARRRECLAAKIIEEALGIESDDVANYCFPKTWPTDCELRARIIGEWLTTEMRYLASRQRMNFGDYYVVNTRIPAASRRPGRSMTGHEGWARTASSRRRRARTRLLARLRSGPGSRHRGRQAAA
jgi:hypothetical protein